MVSTSNLDQETVEDFNEMNVGGNFNFLDFLSLQALV